MAGIYYKLGKMVGRNLRKADWLVQSLFGSDADAVEAEHAVGCDLAEAVAKQMPLDPDPDVQAYVDEIGRRLTNCVSDRRRKFSFRIVQSNEFNAFALPGGFIYVMRPLLELCDWKKEEIAFVLGHEMGHVIARHAINRLMASSVFTKALARVPVGGLLGLGIAQAMAELLNQGYSRDQEFEADSYGVRFLDFAGFDLTGAQRLLSRLRALAKEHGPAMAYFSSHPPAQERIEQIDAYLRKRQKGP